MKTIDLPFEDFLRSRDSWNNAVEESIDKNVFLTWEWLSSWWTHFGDKRQFLLSALTDNERIAAAAPLMRTEYRLFGLGLKKIEFIGAPASDYQSLLLTERNPEHAKLLIKHICRRAADWDLLQLTDISEDFATASILESVRSPSLDLKRRIMEHCPYVALAKSQQDFRRMLGKSFRQNLSRSERSLSRIFTVEFKIVTGQQDLEDWMAVFFQLHQQRLSSRGMEGLFSDRKVRQFHLEVASSFAEKGWLLLAFIILNGQPAAAQYNFKYGNKMYFYLSGFDTAYSKYSVGSLLHLWLIDRCIREGLYEYDFLRGIERYKMRWSAQVRNTLQFSATQKRVIPIILRQVPWADNLYRFAKLA